MSRVGHAAIRFWRHVGPSAQGHAVRVTDASTACLMMLSCTRLLSRSTARRLCCQVHELGANPETFLPPCTRTPSRHRVPDLGRAAVVHGRCPVLGHAASRPWMVIFSSSGQCHAVRVTDANEACLPKLSCTVRVSSSAARHPCCHTQGARCVSRDVHMPLVH